MCRKPLLRPGSWITCSKALDNNFSSIAPMLQSNPPKDCPPPKITHSRSAYFRTSGLSA